MLINRLRQYTTMALDVAVLIKYSILFKGGYSFVYRAILFLLR
jgi:hypothetical protein